MGNETTVETQSSRMKIIIASPSLNFLGGAQRACLHAIKALKKTECRLVLATIDKTDWALVERVFGEAPKPDEELYVFSRMPRIPIPTLKQAFVALLFTLRLFTAKAHDKNRLVINMGGEIVDSLGDIVYVNAVPIRLIHCFPGIQVDGGVQWKVYSRLYSMFLKILGNTASVTVANSTYTQGVIEKYLGKRALVINPPVLSLRIASQASPETRENAVITVSRFRSAKGLAIVPKIANHLKNCSFLLIGTADTESEQSLKDLSEEINRLHVQDRVHVFKNKPYTFTLEALKKAKVFLSTQTTEAFGMSIVESMAAGCVPLVPRAGGPWMEILDCQEGTYGFSYKDAGEAADKVRLLISDERLRSEVSARARERAMAFDSSVFEAKLLRIVEVFSSRVKRSVC
jgi:glycosyltransferase involved in cell wall biosynthesis